MIRKFLLTFIAFSLVYSLAARLLRDTSFDWVLLSIIPYIILGVLIKRYYSNHIALITILFTVLDKIMIFAVGVFFYSRGGDGDSKIDALLQFIKADMFGFFHLKYVFIGSIISILTSIISYKLSKKIK